MSLAGQTQLAHVAPELGAEPFPPPRARWLRSHHVLFLGFSLLVCLATYPDVVFGGRTFLSLGRTSALYEDAPAVAHYVGAAAPRAEIDPGSEAWAVHPWAFEERRALASGSLPLWNRHEGLGHPQLANGQTQTFNPLHWIVLLHPDSPLLWDLHFLLLRFVAALFGCYLLRELGVRLELCLVGAVFGALHGVFTIFLNRADLEAYAWMVVVLFCIARLRNRPGVPSATACAFSMAFCLTAGHPEPSFGALMGAALFALGLGAWRGNRVRYLLGMGGAATAAVLLSAPYWLPFLHFVRWSYNLHPQGAGRGARPPMLALQWLLPGAFNSSRPFALFDRPFENFGFLGASMGALALLGVVSAVAVPQLRRKLLWVWGAVFLALKIFGSPLASWMGQLPLVERMPTELYLHFPVLYLLGIAGLVAASALADVPSRRRLAVLGTAAGALVVILLLGSVLPDTYGIELWPQIVWLAAAMGLGAYATLWLGARPRRRLLAAALLTALVAADLVVYRNHLSHRWNPAEAGPYVRWLQERQRTEPPFRVMGLAHYLMPNYATIYGLDDVRLCDGLMSPEYVEFVRRFLQRDLVWGWFLSADPGAGFDVRNPILNWLNVRYLIGSRAMIAPPASDLQLSLLHAGHAAWDGKSYEIDGVPLPVLFQHPNDAGTVRVRVSADRPVLAFSLAQDPQVWDRGGDGATYSIDVSTRGVAPVTVFSQEIDPKRRLQDRHWNGARVDLSRWAGEDIDLTLRAASGDTTWDWGGWGDLHWEDAQGRRARDMTVAAPQRLRIAFQDPERKNAAVFENPSAWPRIFAVGDPVVEATPAAVLDRIEALKDSPEPVAVVGSDFPWQAWEAACAARLCSPGRTNARVQSVRYSPRAISAGIETDRRVVVVVSDTFFTGWHVVVDGGEQPLFRANYIFRGIILGPGSHQLELRYWPREWTIAIVLGGLGLLGVALAWLVRAFGCRPGQPRGKTQAELGPDALKEQTPLFDF